MTTTTESYDLAPVLRTLRAERDELHSTIDRLEIERDELDMELHDERDDRHTAEHKLEALRGLLRRVHDELTEHHRPRAESVTDRVRIDDLIRDTEDAQRATFPEPNGQEAGGSLRAAMDHLDGLEPHRPTTAITADPQRGMEPRDWVVTVLHEDGDGVDVLYGPYTETEADQAEAAAFAYYHPEGSDDINAIPHVSCCRLEPWDDPT